jgi:hypothetical protein
MDKFKEIAGKITDKRFNIFYWKDGTIIIWLKKKSITTSGFSSSVNC